MPYFKKIVNRFYHQSSLMALLVCMMLFTTKLHAQLYPIQVVTEITPPYSIYLSDYTSVGSNKLNLNLLLTDVTRFNYPVKLKLIIEGEGITITTSASYMPEQIILDGGSPLRLSGDELAAYFNPKNLDFKGYSKEKFNQTGALPEGIYRIGFQVFDYNKNIAVSSFGAATAWLVLNDPPMFNIPEKNVKLTASEPQNIMFQWMPRHLGSPNSAFNAEYVFQIYEIWPDGRNPNEVVASTQPLIENTGASTTFMYSNTTQTPLLPGRQYAYRVEAKDVEGRDLFRNHGYSEVQMFTYGDPCDVPTQIDAQNTSSGNILVNWQATPFNTAFYVQYREANNPTAEWFPKNTYTSTATLTGLKPDMKYEYQVRGVCGAVNSDFSDLLYISTPKMREPKVVCGQLDSAVIITNHVPCTSLLPGDIITTGKFATQVTQASGGSGKWTGEGFMHVPMLGTKVHVMFKNISINEKLQVTSGRVESVYNISNKFDNKPTPASKTDSTKQVTPHVPAVKDTIVVNAVDTIYKAPNGDVKVVDNNGDTTTIHRNIDGSGVIISAQGDTTVVKAGDPVVIKDNTGNTTVVDKDGNITTNTTAKNNAVSKNPIRVTFTAYDKQLFGFDALKDPMKDDLGVYYPNENINGITYVKPWKSVSSNSSDIVMVNISSPKNNPAIKTLKITDSNGVILPLQKTGIDSVQQVTVSGTGSDGTIELTASYADTDTSNQRFTAGKFNVVSYNNGASTHNVVIVPVNTNTLTSTDCNQVQSTLNIIYQQACESYTTSSGPTLKYTYQTFDAKPSDAVSYTSDMLALIKSLKDTLGSSYNSNNFYIFLLNNSNNNNAGIMPFNQNFGFVFTDQHNGKDLERTIAHEIGHGVFGLMHTFDTHGHQPELEQGKTNNLMDYGTDTHMLKLQWDQIHEPVCYTETCFGTGTSGGEAATINIIALLENIRKANQKEYLSLDLTQDQCPHVCYINLKLGDSKLSLLQINCTKAFENDNINEFLNRSNFKLTSSFGPKLIIKPNEKTIVFSETNKGQVAYYQYHEAKENPPLQLPELTDNFLFEFAVLKSENKIFEDYLYPNAEYFLDKIQWISQINSVIQNYSPSNGKCHWCSQFTSSCCDQDAACSITKDIKTKKVSYSCDDGSSCRYNTCCFNTSRYMLEQSGTTLNNERIYAVSLTNQNELQDGINIIENIFDVICNYILTNIKTNKPILIGVYFKPNSSTIPYNYMLDGTTKSPTVHYMLIVGKGFDKSLNKEYFRFYDPGRTSSADGANSSNKLIIDKTAKKISTIYRGKEYILTEIRKNN